MLHLAGGGGADGMGGAPTLDGAALDAPSNEALHPVTLDFGNRQVGGLKAAPNALDQLKGAARDRGDLQAGQAPSWYK